MPSRLNHNAEGQCLRSGNLTPSTLAGSHDSSMRCKSGIRFSQLMITGHVLVDIRARRASAHGKGGTLTMHTVPLPSSTHTPRVPSLAMGTRVSYGRLMGNILCHYVDAKKISEGGEDRLATNVVHLWHDVEP